MTTLTRAKAITNLSDYIESGRLVQNQWSSEDQGREVGCLLHAIGNGDVEIRSTSDCPTSVIPKWVAEWTVRAFNGLRKEDVYPSAKLYRSALESAISFGDAEWDKVARSFGWKVARDACKSARTALQYVPAGEDRPRLAIEAAEAFLDDPTEEKRNAAAAAYAAAANAAAAAYTANAAAAAYAVARQFQFFMEACEEVAKA